MYNSFTEENSSTVVDMKSEEKRPAPSSQLFHALYFISLAGAIVAMIFVTIWIKGNYDRCENNEPSRNQYIGRVIWISDEELTVMYNTSSPCGNIFFNLTPGDVKTCTITRDSSPIPPPPLGSEYCLFTSKSGERCGFVKQDYSCKSNFAAAIFTMITVCIGVCMIYNFIVWNERIRFRFLRNQNISHSIVDR